MHMAYLTILFLLAYQCLCFGEEEKTVHFQESPKSMGWVGVVCCLGEKSPKHDTISTHTLYLFASPIYTRWQIAEKEQCLKCDSFLHKSMTWSILLKRFHNPCRFEILFGCTTSKISVLALVDPLDWIGNGHLAQSYDQSGGNEN